MEYSIVKKETFTVLGVSKEFAYQNSRQEIPLFWQEHYTSGRGRYVCGTFGIVIGLEGDREKFEYLIADPCQPGADIPDGFAVKTIPALTWAVFPCHGALPHALQDVIAKTSAAWSAGLPGYAFEPGYCIEWYDEPGKYPNGTSDENYYSEVWLPVREK